MLLLLVSYMKISINILGTPDQKRFKRVVVKELLNEVHVRHEHSPAAIPLEIQRIKGIAGEDRR